MLYSGAAYTDYITHPLTGRVWRVQDDGRGLVVKAKHIRQLFLNNLDGNRKFENYNERYTFEINQMSTNAENNCCLKAYQNISHNFSV